jgi:galactokinase/mevalonate kinase-like predicted kinase
VLAFIERHLHLLPLGPREDGFRVLQDTRVDAAGAKALADAADACWQAAMACDANAFGAAVRASFEAQVAMFPHMVDPSIRRTIAANAGQALGWKLSGAGGGGYLVLVSKDQLPGTIPLTIRRHDL